MKTIVSATPIRVQADSRSFKIAASIARFGYVSVLVEGEESDLDRACLPFELRSIGGLFRTKAVALADKANPSPNHDWTPTVRKARQILGDLYRLPFLFPFLFLCWYLRRWVVLPLKHIPRASLYYLHEYTLFPAIYLLCKRYNVPLVYDAHDFYPGIKSPTEIRAMNFGQRWLTMFCRYVESRLINNASAVVTVCDGVARLQHETFGCHPIVVRNCHDFRLDQEPPRHLRQVLGLSSDQFLLVAVGNAKKGMAVQEVLDAMLQLPPHVHLAFLGSFYDEYSNSIRSRALQDRVHILPPVKPYEVVPFIRSADASVILYYPRSVNYKNCLPNSFFQAVAAELPLLYPRLPEIERIAEKYVVGIPIDPRVPRSISRAVIQLMSDGDLVATYKRNLRVASHDLSWEKEELILRSLISKALTQNKG